MKEKRNYFKLSDSFRGALTENARICCLRRESDLSISSPSAVSRSANVFPLQLCHGSKIIMLEAFFDQNPKCAYVSGPREKAYGVSSLPNRGFLHLSNGSAHNQLASNLLQPVPFPTTYYALHFGKCNIQCVLRITYMGLVQNTDGKPAY